MLVINPELFHVQKFAQKRSRSSSDFHITFNHKENHKADEEEKMSLFLDMYPTFKHGGSNHTFLSEPIPECVIMVSALLCPGSVAKTCTEILRSQCGNAVNTTEFSICRSNQFKNHILSMSLTSVGWMNGIYKI